MLAVKLTQAEIDYLKKVLGTAVDVGKVRTSLLAKLESKPDKLPAAGKLEQALINKAGVKVCKLATGNAYAVAAKMAGSKDITEEQCAIVGNWLYHQGWITQVTTLDVFRKWDDWYSKAKAFHEKAGNISRSTDPERPTNQGRRTPSL